MNIKIEFREIDFGEYSYTILTSNNEIIISRSCMNLKTAFAYLNKDIKALKK